MDAETALLESKVVDAVVKQGLGLKHALNKFGLPHYTSRGLYRNGYNRIRRNISKLAKDFEAKKAAQKGKFDCNY